MIVRISFTGKKVARANLVIFLCVMYIVYELMAVTVQRLILCKILGNNST